MFKQIWMFLLFWTSWIHFLSLEGFKPIFDVYCSTRPVSTAWNQDFKKLSWGPRIKKKWHNCIKCPKKCQQIPVICNTVFIILYLQIPVIGRDGGLRQRDLATARTFFTFADFITTMTMTTMFMRMMMRTIFMRMITMKIAAYQVHDKGEECKRRG